MTVAALEAAVLDLDARTARRIIAGFDDDWGGEGGLEQLARLAGGGSALAVQLLVEWLDERALARRAVQKFILDEAVVDDVTQDTLISVAQSVRSFRGDAKFTSWLYQIARNRSADFLRRQRATVRLDTQEPGPAMRISSLLASEDAVRQLLGRLPEPYREPVQLRDVSRLSYAEIAEQLGRNLNTVKSHVARGRAMLAAALDEEAGQ